MPFVHIEWLEGRTLEQKRELAKRITDAVSEVAGSPQQNVHVFFTDMKREDYGFGGELTLDRQQK
ncbi:2-hydroxymuconate tautomerase family protein [Tumebacillus sp. DT12]|uniref:Tautomerase n=1 Tax=Tumebacillus lacus TaxID=2995335 RepID=A0ABT3X6S9_9BACL|nr:2-hydroxymuconate tautomerase [Tumebacillus lacus]MCX7571688.1 2-hydroxymuconate tautomerase family protein [Tumebacillus lacus]